VAFKSAETRHGLLQSIDKCRRSTYILKLDQTVPLAVHDVDKYGTLFLRGLNCDRRVVKNSQIVDVFVASWDLALHQNDDRLESASSTSERCA
jgi:hypothetical protein